MFKFPGLFQKVHILDKSVAYIKNTYQQTIFCLWSNLSRHHLVREMICIFQFPHYSGFTTFVFMCILPILSGFDKNTFQTLPYKFLQTLIQSSICATKKSINLSHYNHLLYMVTVAKVKLSLNVLKDYLFVALCCHLYMKQNCSQGIASQGL